MSKLWRELRNRRDYSYLWPLVSTVLVTSVVATLYSATVQCYRLVRCSQPVFKELFDALKQLQPALQLPGAPPEQLRNVTTYAGHLTWSLTTALYVVACLAAVVVASRVIYMSLPGRHGRKIAAIVLTLSTLALLIYGVNQLLYLHNTAVELQRQFLSATVKQDVANIEPMTKLLDGMGFVVALFLALTCSVVLFARTDSEAQLSQQQRQLRFILYAGTITLIFSTLRLSALLHWALYYLQPPPGLPDAAADAMSASAKDADLVYRSLDNLVTTIVTGLGAFYTLLLASVYVPAVLVLNRRAADLPVPEGQPAADRTIPLHQDLLRLAAILGPLLAGPVGELLGRL
jgi:hypothetical protein